MKSNYVQLTIDKISAEQSEILIAQLSELGFEGFEESGNALDAFISEAAFNEDETNEIVAAQNLTFSKNILEQKNWNEEWEKNFEPVTVDDFVTVRAEFHEPAKNVEHEIIITPKMSFGTGHHATTYLMLQQMRQINFENKSVFDFGTGTGILSVLAEKLGAKTVFAVDNDDWSISNAAENIAGNNCRDIQLQLCDSPVFEQQFDVILANINKNVILQFLATLIQGLAINGHLLVSGLLAEDENDILLAASGLGLKYSGTVVRDKWICIHFCN
ncbi:MAG: 50S ribosomal protein L11 methyltransferase [Panacibacter sp.]